MPFITFLCLIIFICLLLGDDGFKIMGIFFAGAVVVGLILGIINYYTNEDEYEYQDDDEEQARDK